MSITNLHANHSIRFFHVRQYVLEILRSEFKDVPYMGIYRCFQPTVVLRDPDLIKDVLIKDFNSFHQNDMFVDEKADPLLANNPFVVTGERWKRSRNMLAPLFTASKVITCGDLFGAERMFVV